ncbi:MAG: indolepyruvate ferredoxin oxidoreductase family protein [Nocardioidaceae bacterium]|nr:indolepyruvate ferredoxin oxidoreductase family protein [Nocardioidaceae bacterium]
MTELLSRPTAPTPDPSSPYDLADRYRVGAPPTLLTGVQAIARLLVEHRALDRRRGLRTASFVSGYQGSPLGGLDKMLGDLHEVLEANDIRFVPGLNEELAATAVWGSQVDLPSDDSLYDGVTGFWYGKGPGVDRATDALRHANMYGVNRRGGAVLLVGDDPASKSSTVPAVSERSLAALGIPVLFPRNAGEIVTLGLHAIEMSRASGCVVALKIVADVADGAWVVDGGEVAVEPTTPVIDWNGQPYAYTQSPIVLRPAMIVGAEAELVGPRTALVHEYSARNGLSVTEVDTPDARLGLVASGSCFDSLRQALTDLGVTDEALVAGGVRLLRLGMMSPVESEAIHHFAQGLEEIVVVEDKTSFIQTQIRDLLYGGTAAPRIIGKLDADRQPLIPSDGELTAGRLLSPLRHALADWVKVTPPRPQRISLPILPVNRAPYFCSGCPHNRSTALPEGSMGGGGIGCHAMVTISDRSDSAVTGVTQMGGEGAQWIGQAFFTETNHLFQNVGDGTFFHSGQLALQACIAAGVNITYKILYNDVVAMTGAQDAEGALKVPQLTHKLHTEGVQKIIICADEPTRHKKRDLAAGTLLWHRDRLDEAQRMLRDIPGVTVLIYDQHCAADARRQRKRGEMEARTKRVVINEAVCEGCGDCGVKSNCLSVQPVETEYGRKTRIEQTSCNTDYSCLDGDCPSFVTVETAPAKSRISQALGDFRQSRKLRRNRLDSPTSAPRKGFPTPPTVAPSVAEAVVDTTQNVFMVGIGGTGIVTVNQVLATAALRAGYDVESLDQTGLSQKAGPVTGHLRFAAGDGLGSEPANRLTPGSAACFLGFDLLTLAEGRNLDFGDPSLTRTVVSTSRTATGSMVYDPAVHHPEEADLLQRVRTASLEMFDFDGLEAADRIFGNTVAANFLLVGAAYQSGALRLPAAAIEEAIEINGTAVAANVAAFRWGRAAVAEPAMFQAAGADAPSLAPREATPPPASVAAAGLEGEVLRLVNQRAADLVDYQDDKLADAYVGVLAEVAAAERAATTETRFSEAVARHLFKLTAYKDEYEVARLLTDPDFLSSTGEAFSGGTISFNLHPPMLRAMGRTKKIAFKPGSHGSLRALARMKGLRGTRADVFGYAHLRKVERELRDHYRAMVLDLAAGFGAEIDPASYDRAVQLAELPDMVRGYESVKLRNVAAYVEALRDFGVEPPRISVG